MEGVVQMRPGSVRLLVGRGGGEWSRGDLGLWGFLKNVTDNVIMLAHGGADQVQVPHGH